MSIASAIIQLSEERGISEPLIRKIIEEFLVTAYEHKYGTAENAVVRFNDQDNEPLLFGRKRIVEAVDDAVVEISLEDALGYNQESELGDELLIEVDPKDFDRIAIQKAKQRAKECLGDIQKDVLFSEYGDRVGMMVVGYIQHERNGNIYVNLGNAEGVLPKKFQSPREEYRNGDRIKAIIYEVNKIATGLQIVLSRTHTDFVRRIFELEVPEVHDHTIEIHNIVREAGYRTKISVYSSQEDVDAVGSCVGVRGVRIQAIIKELEGEKVDIINYSNDICEFIANALSPATVGHVHVLNEEKNMALAVVSNDQLSQAIGRHGVNVRLANRLVRWNIDVKTSKQVAQMNITSESMRNVSQMFTDEDVEVAEEATHVSELPDISPALVLKLQDNRIERISELMALTPAARRELNGLTEDEQSKLEKIIDSISSEQATPDDANERAEHGAVAEQALPDADGEIAEHAGEEQSAHSSADERAVNGDVNEQAVSDDASDGVDGAADDALNSADGAADDVSNDVVDGALDSAGDAPDDVVDGALDSAGDVSNDVSSDAAGGVDEQILDDASGEQAMRNVTADRVAEGASDERVTPDERNVEHEQHGQ